MKANKPIYIFLTIILIIALSGNAFAANWEDFSDITGHWSEQTVKKGFNDGLIKGLDDTSVAPDSPITSAQIITILCRVLGATETADISELGISSDSWYADAAGKALKLNLISAQSGDLNTPITRQDALAMLAKAFCLVPAEPDFAVLNSFSDSSKISSKNKSAIAALVTDNLVTGYNGALNVNSNITRAEFLTVLYRVAENYITADTLTSVTKGGSVLKGSGSLNYINTGKVWFDCSTQAVSLSGVKADAITLRNHRLSSIVIGGNSDISRLAIAVGAGSAELGSSTDYKIGQLRLESCTSASVGPCVDKLELTGNGIAVNLSGAHSYLIITGSNNVITLSSDASLARLKITGDNNTVKLKDGSNANDAISCGEIEITGKGNTLSFNNSSASPCKIAIGGTGNTVSSALKSLSSLVVSGTKADINISSLAGITDFSVSGNENDIELTSVLSFSASISGSLNEIALKSDADIVSTAVTGNSNWLSLMCANASTVSISGSYNTVNKLNEGKVASVALPGINNAFVLYEKNTLAKAETTGLSNIITINGTADTITLAGRKTTLNGSGRVKNLNINASGCTISLTAETVADNSNQAEEARVLKLVTLGYTGNFTLKWAQEHDYESYEKETWINAKGYSSRTEYLIWVNLSMQRVNIFKGSEGAWKLDYSCIVGTGAPGRGTPVGVWKTTYKSWAGWTTSTYTVKPVVGFKDNTGYAFHSRLYAPGTTKISDASIGYPVSHGCVRMYDDDILYIYNNIPSGTTVVVY